MATQNIRVNSAKGEKKEMKYIKFPVVFDNGKMIEYVIESEKGYSDKTGLFQLEGHLYVESDKSSTGYANVNRWIWGTQPDNKLPKEDWTLWKTADGQPIAWLSYRICDEFNIALAETIMRAYKTGEGLIDCPFKKPTAKQVVIKTADVMESAPVPDDADAPDEEDVQEDLAVLDGMGESPLDRLSAGDPTFFMELGATEKQAKRWSKWIRENNTSFNNIADVSKVQGIGKKTMEALTASYNEKYSA